MPKNFIIILISIFLIIIGIAFGIYFYQRSSQLEKRVQELEKAIRIEKPEKLIEREKLTEQAVLTSLIPFISPNEKLFKIVEK